MKTKNKYKASFVRKVKLLILGTFAVLTSALVITSYVGIKAATSDWKETDANGDGSNKTVEQKYYETDGSGELIKYSIGSTTAAPYTQWVVDNTNGKPHLKNALPIKYMLFEFDITNMTAAYVGVNMTDLSADGFSYNSTTHKYSNSAGTVYYDGLEIPEVMYHYDTIGGLSGIREFRVKRVYSTLSDVAYKLGLSAIQFPDSVTYIAPAALYGCYNLEYLQSPIVGRTVDDGAKTYFDNDGNLTNRTVSELKSETLGSMFFGDDNASFTDTAIQNSFSYPERNLAGWPKDESGIMFSSVTRLSDLPIPIYPDITDYRAHISDADEKDGDNPICPLWYLEDPIEAYGANGAVYAVPKSLKYVKITKEEGLIVRAFFNWRYLKEVWLPDSCKNLTNDRVFNYCENLENIRLPKESSTSMGVGFFGNCESLKELTLPLNLEKISEGAMFKCLALKKVDFPSSVKSIDNGAFAYCKSLKDYRVYTLKPGDDPNRSSGFNLPQTLQKIGTSAFLNNQEIQLVDIPSTVTEIGECAFQACINVTSMTIPFVGKTRGGASSKEQLFGWIFGSGNQGWTIGSETPVAGDSPASSDTSITTKVYTANEKYSDGTLGFSIPKSLTTLNIKDETRLNAGALQSLVSLTKLTINEGCSYIALGALGCNTNPQGDTMNLKELTTPNLGEHNRLGGLFGTLSYTGAYKATDPSTVTSSSAGVSYYIPSTLEKVEVSNQATIPAWAFANLLVKSVVIGNNTTWMDNCVFHGNDYLESLTLPFVGAKRGEADRYDVHEHIDHYGKYYTYTYRGWERILSEDVFFRIFSYTKVGNEYYLERQRYVSKDSFNWYGRYIPWSLTELIITDDQVINNVSLDFLYSLKKLEIKKATYISEGAMQGLTNLEEITLPFIGADANTNNISGRGHTLGWVFGTTDDYFNANFYSAYQHVNYSIPRNLKKVSILSTQSVPNYAFANLPSVNTINLGTRVSILGDHAFYNDSSLEHLNYQGGSDYSYVSDYAFYNCKMVNANNFYSIVNSPNVNGVGNYAFAYSNVRSTIPNKYLGLTGDDRDTIDFTKINTIGNYAFCGSAGIEYAEVPDNVNYLGSYAFSNCPFLTYARLAEGKVSEGLFSNDIRLNNLNLKSVTTTIPKAFFNGCTSIVIVDEVKYNNNATANGAIGAPNNGILLDQATTALGDYSFANCLGLTSFPFPAALTTIGNHVFENDVNLAPLTLPKSVIKIGQHSWDGVRTPEQSEYYFWVYYREAEWPKGWLDNWNCYWPVYIIGDTSEYMFTYEYNKEYSGYLITGVEKNIELPEFLTFPVKHHGLPVVGIVNCNYNGTDAGDSLTSVAAKNLKKVVIPASYKVMANSIFGYYTENFTYQPVEVYYELTKAEIMAGVKVITPNEVNKPLKPLEEIDDVLKWAPSDGSAIFTKDYWEYGKNQGDKTIPYIPLSKLIYDIELTVDEYDFTDKYTYDGLPKEPTLLAAILPGIHGETYNKLLYAKYDEYQIGEHKYAPIFKGGRTGTPIFKLAYEDNVLAGKGKIIVSLNNQQYEFDDFIQFPEVLKGASTDYDYTPYTKTTGTNSEFVFGDGIEKDTVIDTPYNVYNKYMRSSDQLPFYTMNMCDTATLTFTINKKEITLFPFAVGNEGGFWSWDNAEYTGEKWKFNEWNSTNVQWGAEGTVTNAFRFVGSVSTASKDVKLESDKIQIGTGYFSNYNEGYYQSTPHNVMNENNVTAAVPADIFVDKDWAVYDTNGRDLTANFTVKLGFVKVKIVPMKVTLVWLNDDGSEALWNSESSSGMAPVSARSNQDIYYDGTNMRNYPKGINNGFRTFDYTSVLIYPYLAKDILPQAKVVRWSTNDNLNGQLIEDSRIKLAYNYFNNGNPHPFNNNPTSNVRSGYYNASYMYPNYIPGNYSGDDYDSSINLVTSAWITENDGRHNYDLLYYDGTALDAEFKADGTSMTPGSSSTYYDRWGKAHNSSEGRLGQIIYQGYYISKGKIKVEVSNNSWVIGVNDDAFQAYFGKDGNGGMYNIPSFIHVTGVGDNSYIQGALASMILNPLGQATSLTNKKGAYTYEGVAPDSDGNRYVIRWKGDLGDAYMVDLLTSTGGVPDKYHYGIYNDRNGVKAYENQYYDEIELVVNLNLLYNKFNTDFRIDDNIVTTVANSIGDAAQQKALYIEYHSRGLWHTFTATDSATRTDISPRIFNGVAHDALTDVWYEYTKDGVSLRTKDPYTFLLLNEYAVGVQFERKNFDTMYYQVRIVVVPTDVQINDTLSKVYDGNPLMIVGDVIQLYNGLITAEQDQNSDGVVNKTDAMLAYYKHDALYNFLDEDGNITTDPSKYVVNQTGVQTIQYNYYDSNNNLLTKAPINVGEYWIEIDVFYKTRGNYGDSQFASSSSETPDPPERERFFNEFSKKIKFYIKPRPITIDLSKQFVDLTDGVVRQGSKVYDKKAVEIDFNDPTNGNLNYNMIVAGSLVKNDIFTGQMYTFDGKNRTAEIGTYGNGGWWWYGASSTSTGWQVIENASPFENHSMNYEVKFINSFKIDYCTFAYSASDNDVQYDYLRHTINFTIANPIENATIKFWFDNGRTITKTYNASGTESMQQLVEKIIPYYTDVKSEGRYATHEDYYEISYEITAPHYKDVSGSKKLYIRWKPLILNFDYAPEGKAFTLDNYFNYDGKNGDCKDITVKYYYDGLPHYYDITSHQPLADVVRFLVTDSEGNTKVVKGPLSFTNPGEYTVEFFITNGNFTPAYAYMKNLRYYQTYSGNTSTVLNMQIADSTYDGGYSKIAKEREPYVHFIIENSTEPSALANAVNVTTTYETEIATDGTITPIKHSFRINLDQNFNPSSYTPTSIPNVYVKTTSPQNKNLEFYIDKNPNLTTSPANWPAGFKVEYSVDGQNWIEYKFNDNAFLETLPVYTDAGTYNVSIRVLARGLAPVELTATLKIEKATFDSLVTTHNLRIEDYGPKEYDGEYHSIKVLQDPDADSRTIGDKVIDFAIEYTDNLDANNYHVDAGFQKDPYKYKDAGVYRNFVRLTAPNYETYYLFDPIESNRPIINYSTDTQADIETLTKPYAGDVEILQAELAGIVEYREIQFSKYPLTTAQVVPNDISLADNALLVNEETIIGHSFAQDLGRVDGENNKIYTIHDGPSFALFYELEIAKDGTGAEMFDGSGCPIFEYDGGNLKVKNPTTAPIELGYYYVEITYMNTNNCKEMKAYGFVKIVPKVLEVKYTKEAEYIGVLLDPLAYVETGNDDEIVIIENLDTVASDNPEAIKIGTYYYDLDMYMLSGDAAHYVLDTYRIEFKITKRHIHIKIDDVEHPYDMQKWSIYSDDFEGSDYGHYIVEGSFIENHKLRLQIETQSYIATTYVYDSKLVTQPSNRVNVVICKPYYLTDPDDITTEVDVSDMYEITFDLKVKIVYPQLSLLGTEQRIKYDGNTHRINVSSLVPSYVRGWRAVYSLSKDAYDAKDYSQFELYNNWSYKNVGEYHLYVYMTAYMFEPAFFDLTLIIEPADLAITIDKIDNDADNDLDMVFNGSDNQALYTTTGLVAGDTLDIKRIYIPREDYTIVDLKAYIDSNIEKGLDFANKYNELYDAGEYWVIVYSSNADNKNYLSAYDVKPATIQRRDLYITYPTSFHAVEVWNGSKFSYLLGNSTVDLASLISGHYVYDENVHTSPTLLSSYIMNASVRTNNSNAGMYYGATDFEFDDFIIYASDKNKNVASSYRPVIGPDFDVEIQKVYLTPDTFKVTTPYVKTYDAEANIPPIDTLSDGIIKYEFYQYNEATGLYDIPLGVYFSNSVTTPAQFTNAGKYKVLITIAEGTNHYAYPQPTDTDYPAVEAEVECLKKAINVHWEDLEVDFNAEQQKPKAYFIRENGDREYLKVEFYNILDGSVSYSKLNAGEYEVEAKFTNPIDDMNYRLFTEADRLDLYAKGLITEEEYYAYEINTAIFKIKKLKLIIPIGDIAVDSSARWSMTFDSEIFKGQEPYDLIVSKKLQFFDEQMTGKSIIRTNHSDADRVLPGVYNTMEQFELDINITTPANSILGIPAIRVTDSFEFDVDGQVLLESKEIIFTSTDVIEITYNADYVRPSDYISIVQPRGKSSNVNYNGVVAIEYSIDEGATWQSTEPKIIDVGTYKVYYRMFDNSSEDDEESKYNSTGVNLMTIIINQKEAYLQFTRTGLDKVYDDNPVSKSTVSLLGGYNGTANDLVFKFYEGPSIVKDGSGNPTNLMASDPIDVGTYLLVVTSNADTTATTKNYTDLYVEQVFEIKKRTIKMNLDLDYQSINFGTSKYKVVDTLKPGTGYNTFTQTGLCPYDKLDYDIVSFSLIERGYYTYILSQIQMPVPAVGDPNPGIKLYDKNADTSLSTVNPDFILNYKISSTTRVDMGTSAPLDITSNYLIDLNLKITAHYPYIRAKIENVNAVYDGLPHEGTKVLTSAPGVLATGSSYSETEYTLNDPTYRLNLSDMRFTYNTIYEPLEFDSGGNVIDGNFSATPITRTLPGTTRVYYRIQSNTDPHEVFEGSYVINVSKMTRSVTFPDLDDMVYKNAPYGYQDVPSKYTVDGNDYFYYLPCNWDNISIVGKSGVVDDFDRSKIQVYYRKNNSNQNLNEAIEAGEYTVYLVIPESTYYKKSTTKATFRINQAVIYIRDTATPLEVGYNGSSVEYSNFDGSNMYATVDSTSTSQNLTYNGMNLSIVGTLSTSSAQIGRYKEGSDIGYLLWNDVISPITGDTKRFFIYDNVTVGTDVNMVDVTENFIINIKDASIFIKGSDMVVDELSQEVVYTGNQVNPNFKVLVPTITQITTFKYRPYVVGDPEPNIDTLDSNWISNVNDPRISPINVGSTTIWVLLDAPNYNKKLFKYTTTIVKNKVNITIPDQSKEYDALEVLEPINFYPNTPPGETVDRSQYTIIYKEYDEATDKYGPLKDGLTRPINVGKYQIIVTVPDSLNYNGGTFDRYFTISPRRLYLTEASWNQTVFVYNSEPQAPVLSNIPLPIGLSDEQRKHFSEDYLKYTVTQVTGGDASHMYVGVYKINVDVTSPNYTLAGLSTINYSIIQRDIIVQISANLFQNSYYEFYQYGKNGFDPSTPSSDPNVPQIKYIDGKQATYSFNTYLNLGTNDYTIDTSVGLAGNDHFRTKLVLVNKNVGLHTRYPFNVNSDFLWYDESVDITNSGFTVSPTTLNYKPVISRVPGAVEDVTNNYRISYKLSVMLDFNTTNLVINNFAGPYDGKGHTIRYTVGNVGSYNISYRTNPSDPWTKLPLINKDGVMIPDASALPTFTDVARNGDGSISFYTVYLLVEVAGLAAKTAEGTVMIYPFNPMLAFANPYEAVDKVYDAMPYTNPAVTFKDSTVTNPPIYEYYKLVENPLTGLEDEIFLGAGVNPVNVGHYRLKVSVASGQNFDNAEISRDFYITKRPLVLYINGGNKVTKQYDGNVWSTNVTNEMFSNIYINNVEVTGIAPGDVSTAAVKNGSIFEAVPNVYQTVLADVKLVLNTGTGEYSVGTYELPSEFTWKYGKFFVYRGSKNTDGSITLATTGSGTGVSLIDATDNYDLQIYAEVEIQKGTIDFSVADYEGVFNGVNSTVTVNVSDPTYGYTVWYTTDPVNVPWSTTPISRSSVGVTTVYVKITAPNYLDAQTSATITIKPLPLPTNGGENPPSSYPTGMTLIMYREDLDNPGNYIKVVMSFDTSSNTWTNVDKIPGDVSKFQYILTPYYPATTKVFKDQALTNDITNVMQNYNYPPDTTTQEFKVFGALLQLDSSYALDSSMNPQGEYKIRLNRMLPSNPGAGPLSINVKVYYYDQSGVRQEVSLGYDSSTSTWTNNDLIPDYVNNVEYEITSNFVSPDSYNESAGDKVEEVTTTTKYQLNVDNSVMNSHTLPTKETSFDLLLTRYTGSTKDYKVVLTKADPTDPSPSDDPTATKLVVIYEANIGGVLTQVTVPLTYDKANKKWDNKSNPIPSDVNYVKVKFSQYSAGSGSNAASVYTAATGASPATEIYWDTFTSQNLTGKTTLFEYDVYQTGVTTPNRYQLEINKKDDASTSNPNLEYDKNYVYNGQPYMSTSATGRPRYNTLSTGTQTIKYYLPTDLDTPIAGDGMALTAPINAGDYVFIITVAADSTYAQASVTQTFTIKKLEVDVLWDDLSQEYDGTVKSPKAKFVDISGNDVPLGLTATSSQTNVGKYNSTNNLQAEAKIDLTISGSDAVTNYSLKTSSCKSDWEIVHKKVTLPELKTKTFEYLDKIIFEATSGDVYEMDDFGTITKWTKPDGSTGDTTKLDFKIIPSVDKNPDMFYEIDGVTVKSQTTHAFTIQLKDKANMMWANKLSTDADKSNDVTGNDYSYVIEPKDLSDTSKYEIIVTFDDPQIYDGKAKEPVTKVSYKDLATNVVTDLVIYTETDTGIPGAAPLTNINTASCIVTYKDNINVTRANSTDPTDTSIPEKAQIYVDGFHFYKFSNDDFKFEIKKEKPSMFTLKSDATYEFMQATFDGNDAHISEDHIGMGRALPNLPDIFLGHVVEETPLDVALAQLDNPTDCIRVYDPDGNYIDPSDYQNFYLGTNFKLELYDSKAEAENITSTTITPIDTISVLLFGDMDGDGMISVADQGIMNKILAGDDYLSDPKSLLYWFAACVNKNDFLDTSAQESILSVSVASSGILTKHLGNDISINDDYKTSSSSTGA